MSTQATDKQQCAQQQSVSGPARILGARTYERWQREETRHGRDHTEVLCRICRLWERGLRTEAIVEAIQDEYGIGMSREEPNLFVADAAARGWIRYRAAGHDSLRHALRDRFAALGDVEVVHTSAYSDVAEQGASTLLGMLAQLRRERYDEVHIGLAGGHAVRVLAQRLAERLMQPQSYLPKRIIFHAMGAGLNMREPSTGPNSLLTLFETERHTDVERRFVGLHAPALVRTADLLRLRQLEGIRDAYEDRAELDIVVTSASAWDDPHGLFREYMANSQRSFDALESASCIGDMLWQPLGPDGPIATETEIRAMTLAELTELSDLIAGGKRVLLVLGPCSKCNRPKGELLEAILRMEPCLITDLVVDSRSARLGLSLMGDNSGHEELAGESGPPASQGRRPRGWRHQARRNGLDYHEVRSVICRLFTSGHVPSEITEGTRDEYGVQLRREEPYFYIAEAMQDGCLSFEPPLRFRLEERIRTKCSWLRSVTVVDADEFRGVGWEAAKRVVRLLQQTDSPPVDQKRDVHIGFAGGHAMRRTCGSLAALLAEPIPDLARTLDSITFHALVSGFDVREPMTDPNAFFGLLNTMPPAQVERRFLGLHAPSVVERTELQHLEELDDFREAKQGISQLDIVVTSASQWSDHHSMLRRYMSYRPGSLAALESAGCRGDLLWQPIGPGGPIDTNGNVEIQAMTVLPLGDLPDMVRRGCRVLLALGPCGTCRHPKGEVLSLLLAMDPPLITDLVVDHRTAEAAVRTH